MYVSEANARLKLRWRLLNVPIYVTVLGTKHSRETEMFIQACTTRPRESMPARISLQAALQLTTHLILRSPALQADSEMLLSSTSLWRAVSVRESPAPPVASAGRWSW